MASTQSLFTVINSASCPNRLQPDLLDGVGRGCVAMHGFEGGGR